MNWLPEESVTKELSRVKESVIPNLHKDIIALAKDLKAAEQTNQRLVKLATGAISFSQHHHTCGLLNHLSSNACTCGLDELRAEIEKLLLKPFVQKNGPMTKISHHSR